MVVGSSLLLLNPLVSLCFLIFTLIINPKNSAFRQLCSDPNISVICAGSVKIKGLVITQLTQIWHDFTVSLMSKCPNICKYSINKK